MATIPKRALFGLPWALLGLLGTQEAIALANDNPEGPAEPVVAAQAGASNANPSQTAAVKKPPAKAEPTKPALAKPLAKPLTLAKPPAEKAVAVVKKPALKLAPSAQELEKERHGAAEPPPPPKKDPREGTPKQDPRWPTHVDYTRGPGSPVGSDTAGDRKATLIDASGPQQGVIRNRF